jgi:glycosyltransferase involved in cell wall biosynthesis
MAGWLSRRSGGRPTVSIAMATYNGETYLRRQLQSLAEQTLRPSELVVRDDGSNDGTLEVVREFAATAPFPVTVLPGGERLGYAQNFVTAAQQCSGDLLFFADQDDAWRPAKLEVVAGAVRRGEPQALFHDFALVSDDGSELEPSAYARLEGRGLSRAVAIKGCTLAVTREFADLWGWPPADTTISHDFWVALLATAFEQRVTLDEVLIDHRLHGEQTSGWVPDDSSREFTRRGEPVSDVELLLDLVIKGRRVGAWTEAFLDVSQRVGDRLEQGDADRLRSRLRVNRRRHRQARRARRAETSGSTG